MLQEGLLEAPLQMYAALAEGGYEVAQSNVAFLLDQHVTHKPHEPLLGMLTLTPTLTLTLILT